MHLRLCLACLLLAPAVHAGNWFRVTAPGTPRFPVVEVDLASLHLPLGQPEAMLRVTLAGRARHPRGFRYRSFEAVVRYDCAAGTLEPLAVQYFEGPQGAGDTAAFESNLRRRGVQPGLLQVLPPRAGASLLRASCAFS